MSDKDTNHYSPLPSLDEVPEVKEMPGPPPGVRAATLQVWEETDGDQLRIRVLAAIPDNLSMQVPGLLIMAARAHVATLLDEAPGGMQQTESTLVKIREPKEPRS